MKCVGDADPKCFFTEAGVKRTLTCTRASVPKAIFHVREGIPLRDYTNYELIEKLQSGGWVWQAWVPPKSRAARLRDAFQPYKQGGPKQWYSNRILNRHYLMVLSDVEPLCSRGLSEVPRGRHENDYKRILEGDFSLSVRPVADIQPDIEVDDVAPGRGIAGGPPRAVAVGPREPRGARPDRALEEGQAEVEGGSQLACILLRVGAV